MSSLAREFPNQPQRWSHHNGRRIGVRVKPQPEVVPVHWSLSDDRAIDLPPQLQAYLDEARGDAHGTR